MLCSRHNVPMVQGKPTNYSWDVRKHPQPFRCPVCIAEARKKVELERNRPYARRGRPHNVFAALLWVLALAGIYGLVTSVLAFAAQATWKPEYAELPQDVQDWYASAELTEAAKKRLSYIKCCDHADEVKTKFRVSKNNGNDQWWYLAGETWKRIPDDVIHWNKSGPDGKAVLFIYNGNETCFFPAAAGI